MEGGLLPGYATFIEYERYNYVRYSAETGLAFCNEYYLKFYQMQITLNLN